jgi:hypothetical protein
MLLTLALLVSASAHVDQPRFSTPELVLADGQALNAVEGMLFPSPVLFDIDRDGQRELVCGDLWGYLRVYENSGTEKQPVWGPAEKLKSGGEVIKVSNW